tara:strand:- start:13 stop:519 length:507 start_codon:yes stop_codon:yes gene_type:complete
MLTSEELLLRLDKSDITYQVYNHPPLHTVEDSIKSRGLIKGAHSKNLFLKNKKNQFFLISCIENRKIDLKKISKSLNLGNTSFAKEEYLLKYLGVKPGSVTPFGLLNDTKGCVEFYLDSQFLENDMVNFHPLLNTSTISLKRDNFVKFLIENNKKVNIFNFTNYSLME